MNNNIDQIKPENEKEQDNKRVNNILIISIIFAVVLLIGLVTSRVLTTSNNKPSTTDNSNSTTDNSTPIVEENVFETKEEAMDSVKRIVNAQENADNYDIVFKEETKDKWVVEKINKTTGKVEEEYYVGKNNGIINTKDLNTTASEDSNNTTASEDSNNTTASEERSVVEGGEE